MVAGAFLVVDVELPPEPVQVDEEHEHGERERDQQRVVLPRGGHERRPRDAVVLREGLRGGRDRGCETKPFLRRDDPPAGLTCVVRPPPGPCVG